MSRLLSQRPERLNKFKGALFDMDGLLLDTERMFQRSFRASLAALDFPLMHKADEIFACLIGLPQSETERVLGEQTEGHLNIAKLNFLWDENVKLEFAKGIQLRPGVEELFQCLSDQNTPIAIATSTVTNRARAHLDEAGLSDFISALIGGDQVERGKPQPDIYHAAAAAIDCSAEDCAAFEDSNVGIRAAVASGATAVQVPDLIQPDASVRSLGHHIATDVLSGARAIGLIK